MLNRSKDQGTRRCASNDRQPRVADEIEAPVTGGASGVLARGAQASQALRMVHQAVLLGARRHVSQALNRLLLQGSEGDGIKALVEGVLIAHHQGAHAQT